MPTGTLPFFYLLPPPSCVESKMEEQSNTNGSQFASLDLPFLPMQDPSRFHVEKLVKRRSRPSMHDGGRRRKHQMVRRLRNESEGNSGAACNGESDGEKEEVERKIWALRRLLPGGEALGVERLFEETAEYILALQGKVESMKLIASYFERVEKEKTKIGG